MVPWIYQAEINSLAMRARYVSQTFEDVKGWPRTNFVLRGASAAVATNWVFGFVCTQFTSVGIRNLGYKFYISTYR